MSKKRGVLAWVLFALATILLFVSSLTVWSKRQLLDDQAWANSSTQLLANDEVRGAIAQKLSDALFQRVDVEAQLRERLPAQRKGTAAVLAAALQNTVVPTAAQTAMKILKALSSLLLIAVVALYALAIYLARGRRRLLLGATGASLVFVGLVIASLRRFLGGAIVDALVKTEANKQPVRVIWSL